MFASAKLAALLYLFAATALAATALAAPATFNPSSAKEEIVDRPHITEPTEGAVWVAGSTQTVTWNTAEISSVNRDQKGSLYLGFLEDGDYSEHLQSEPIADNFYLIAGKVDVKVPQVATRDDYILVLFGDSGNASPTFTITNATVA